LWQQKKRLKEEFLTRYQRAGLPLNMLTLIESEVELENLGPGSMDWIVLDMPCSSVGRLKRSPELKWQLTPQHVEKYAQEQRNIFERALKFLHPNGRIVYITCSFLPNENENQIEYFKMKFGLRMDRQALYLLPSEQNDIDAFFGATLKRLEQ